MKKSPKMLRGFVIFTLFSLGRSEDCSVINVSCADIKTDDGFKFSYNCFQPGEDGSTVHDVEISHNEIKIAHGPPFKPSDDVMSTDNNSITTRECRRLHVKCIVYGEMVMESCWYYEITGHPASPQTESTTLKSPDPSPSPNPADPPPGEPLVKETPWVRWLIGIGVITVIFGIITGILCLRKKKVKKHFTDLLVLRGLRTSQAGRETAGGTGESLSANQRARDDNPQNGKLDSVSIHSSIDPASRGETPASSGLGRTLSIGSIQEPKNSTRDDPGGVNDNKGGGLHWIREMHNGRTGGDRGPEDENGGQPLLQNQGAANADMTGGAGLVYECGSGTQQVRWSSTAPHDADVESTLLNMKNTMTDE